MVACSGDLCIFLLFSVLGASNGAIISPGSDLQGPRAVISFADHQTTEDRRAYLQGAQEQGYTCWMFPSTHEAAVCIQNPASIYSEVPESGEALRRTLSKVSLRAWLPSILCQARPKEDDNPSTLNGVIDHNACLEVVEAALANQPDVDVILTDSRRDIDSRKTAVRVAVDETPWLKAMQYWIGRGDEKHFGLSSAAYIVLASERAKMQLRPALWGLAGGENGAPNMALSAATASSLAVPSAQRIQSLLALIDSGTDHTSTKTMPSLRMTLPKPGGRISGVVVPFIGEVVLGAAVTTRLDGAQFPPAAQRQLRDDNISRARGGGDSWSAFDRHQDTMRAASPLDHCEVRVVVDDAVASTIPIAAAASPDGSGTSDPTAAVAIETTMAPNYEQNRRCTEHPGAIETEGVGYDTWATNDQLGWLVETRAIDKVCTRETFGQHRIYGELACRHSSTDDGTVGEQDNKNVAERKDALAEEQPSTPLEEGRPPPRQPEAAPKLEDSHWEVLATSAVVEYFHTGNLVDMLSSSPWAAAGEEEKNETRDDEGGGLGATNPLLTSPPEELSVALYLENDPTTTLVVVTVPRWFSDGEIWEVAHSACQDSVGPWQGILVNTNDCVHLMTSAIAAKRVDLYSSMSLRLMTYLESVSPDFVFEGNTGGNPEKVEALGAIPREGGGRVRTICEVGFNAGHSSLNWLLSSHPTTNVLAFDLGNHDYVKYALDFLQAVFPGRLKLIVGDSHETVPAYALAEETTGRDSRFCDVVFVDGDHTEEGAYADLINFQELTSRGWNVLAVDDMEQYPVDAAWRRFRDEGRGRLERIVKATGEQYSHSSTDQNGDTSVVMHDTMYAIFMQYGHTSLGIGRYLKT